MLKNRPLHVRIVITAVLGLFILILVLLILVGTLYGITFVRRFLAFREVDSQTEELLPELSYDPGKSPGSKKETLHRIYALAKWEEDTRLAIDKLYGFEGYLYYDTYEIYKKPKVSDKKEDFIWYAEEMRCREALAELDQVTRDSIEQIFHQQDLLCGVQKQDVLSCYDEKNFDLIVKTVQAASKGDLMNAFYWANGQYLSRGIVLPMDIAYAMFPDVMLKACLKNINDAVHINTRKALTNAVECTDAFIERYDLIFTNYDPVKEWLETLNYAHNSGVPVVGMSLEDAEDTSLGKPSQTDNNYDTEAGNSGKLTWTRGSKRTVIFEAWYSADTITKINDKRSASQKNRSYSQASGSSGSSGSGSGRESWEDPVDPDDYNLDGFYEDHYDEFDDIDDAYDAFLDDEEWEND